MYKFIIRNYSTASRYLHSSSKYIPSKHKTWCYKKGYYKNNKSNKSNKKSYVSNNLNDIFKNYYDNKYIYRK